MNYLVLKTKIDAAIEKNPTDYAAYEDMFALCREYEKINFAIAHEWNHQLKDKVCLALRMVVQMKDFGTAERLNNLHYRSLLFSAPHFFDDYLQAVEFDKPLDKKFYLPRRHYLKRYVEGYQDVLDGKLDFLSISMPKRCGKGVRPDGGGKGAGYRAGMEYLSEAIHVHAARKGANLDQRSGKPCGDECGVCLWAVAGSQR